MVLISYDISDNKLRGKFAKYLQKFGRRIQYSVFEIENSKKILDNIVQEVCSNFEKRFSQSDSVIIVELSAGCNITRYGYAQNEEMDFQVIN